MYKYRVTYNGKVYHITADSAVHAIDKLLNRKVFGTPLIPCRINWGMVDADTHGEIYAKATAFWSDWTSYGPGPVKTDREIIATLDSVNR